MRHLKNANELVLYAAISCSAAFIGRLFPSLYFPILLLRLGIFLYCIYVIATLERNREMASILGCSLFIGMLGGYWDLIEVYLRYNLESIARLTTITALFFSVLAGLFIYIKHGQTSKK